jgi:hypothetical protein
MPPPGRGSPPEIVREMTAGEVRLANYVFGTALDTRRVRIHNHPYLMFQGRHVAMTPNGELYFRPEDYVADFSPLLSNAAWMVHELTHAWQFQQGRSVRGRGLLEQCSRLFGADPYKYGKLDTSKPFDSYMNEQQAMIVEDYFRLMQHHPTTSGSGTLDEYRAVIPFAPKPHRAAKSAAATGSAGKAKPRG